MREDGARTLRYDEALREIGAVGQGGDLRPVYLVVGSERFLADRLVAKIREACLAGGLADFNEDAVTAGECDVDRVLSAARTVPMMAKRRFVLVRSVERWEPRAGSDGDGDGRHGGALDRLADYAEHPIDTTTIVLASPKLDNRRRIMVLAKKQGFLVTCEPLDDASLARWIEQGVRERGGTIAPDVARLLAQVAGPELGYVNDAVERLTLYVGQGGEVTEAAISEIVVKVRETSVFSLVDAVGKRDRARALAALVEVFDPRDRGLPLIGLLAWSVRQLLKFEIAMRNGARPEEAATRAGAPPFKARELAAQVRGLSTDDLQRWLLLLAEADLALKGSKRPPAAIMETLVLAMAGT